MTQTWQKSAITMIAKPNMQVMLNQMSIKEGIKNWVTKGSDALIKNWINWMNNALLPKKKKDMT